MVLRQTVPDRRPATPSRCPHQSTLRFVGLARVLLPVPFEKRYSTSSACIPMGASAARDVFNRWGCRVEAGHSGEPLLVPTLTALVHAASNFDCALTQSKHTFVCFCACVRACVRVFVPVHGCLCPQVVCDVWFGVHDGRVRRCQTSTSGLGERGRRGVGPPARTIHTKVASSPLTMISWPFSNLDSAAALSMQLSASRSGEPARTVG